MELESGRGSCWVTQTSTFTKYTLLIYFISLSQWPWAEWTYSGRCFYALCFCRFLSRVASCWSATKCAHPSRLCTPAPSGLRKHRSQVHPSCWTVFVKSSLFWNSEEKIQVTYTFICLSEPLGRITFLHILLWCSSALCKAEVLQKRWEVKGQVINKVVSCLSLRTHVFPQPFQMS